MENSELKCIVGKKQRIADSVLKNMRIDQTEMELLCKKKMVASIADEFLMDDKFFKKRTFQNEAYYEFEAVIITKEELKLLIEESTKNVSK